MRRPRPNPSPQSGPSHLMSRMEASKVGFTRSLSDRINLPGSTNQVGNDVNQC